MIQNNKRCTAAADCETLNKVKEDVMKQTSSRETNILSSHIAQSDDHYNNNNNNNNDNDNNNENYDNNYNNDNNYYNDNNNIN